MSVNKNKKNILFISHVSSKQFGGAERVLDDIVSNIDQNRFKTFLLLQNTSSIDDLDWYCATNTEIVFFDFGSLSHRFKLIGLLGMFFRMAKGFFHIRYLIKKHNIDIICANSITAAAFSALPARISGKRFFYYEHNIVDQRKGHLIGLALQPVSKLATDIICISKSVKDSLEREGIPSTKLHLVYNGCDYNSLDNSTSIDRSLPPRHQENVLRIGMVANYMPWKRHELFLELISELSNKISEIKIEATIVGGCLPGNEVYFQQIVDWVKEYEGNVNYTLTGFQDNVADYYRSFDIIINPAKAEPFGLIFIEAMYLGCVVIGSIDGAASEIISDGVTGFIVDFDYKNIVLKVLINLALNKQNRIEIGECASKAVKNDFSIKNQVIQLEKLFDKTV